MEKTFTEKEVWTIYGTTIFGCSLIALGLAGTAYNKGRQDAIRKVARTVENYMDGYRAGAEAKANEDK